MRNAPDKNPFKGVSDLLARGAPAKRTLHFLSYAIDLLLVFVASYLIFLGGNAIVTSSSGYQASYAAYEEEITYYQDMTVDAHIAEYLDRDSGLLADNEDLAIKAAIRNVLLSFTYDDANAHEFNDDPMDALQKQYTGTFYADVFEKSSFSNDYIARFFIEYAPEHNNKNELAVYGDRTYQKYVIDYYKSKAANYTDLKFIYVAGDSELPHLRPGIAYDIFQFLIRAEGFDRTAYDDFVRFYSGMLTDCVDRVFKSDTYQNGRYQDYLHYRKEVTVAVNTTLIVSIVLAYYIAIFLPQMLFRDGRSFGKIFMRLGVINTDKTEVEPWKFILRSLLASVSMVYVAFLVALLPPFNGSSMLLYLPYITIGTLDISMINICITVFAISVINSIFMLLTHEKRSLTDLLFQTMTVDVTLLDEPDYDERDETPA